MKKKILVVEDRTDIAELIQYHLEKEGYICIIANNGEQALSLLQQENVDLIILDLMLPKISGIEVLRMIKNKEAFKRIPVLIESAKSEDEDVILGLEIGAEDYITKPFSTKVLMARIRRVLQRYERKEQEIINFREGELMINPDNREVHVLGKEIMLTSVEYGILLCLYNNQNRIMTREKILEEVWQNKTLVIDRVIDVHINSLRKKLGSIARFIHTIRGIGYLFKTTVEA